MVYYRAARGAPSPRTPTPRAAILPAQSRPPPSAPARMVVTRTTPPFTTPPHTTQPRTTPPTSPPTSKPHTTPTRTTPTIRRCTGDRPGTRRARALGMRNPLRRVLAPTRTTAMCLPSSAMPSASRAATPLPPPTMGTFTDTPADTPTPTPKATPTAAAAVAAAVATAARLARVQAVVPSRHGVRRLALGTRNCLTACRYTSCACSYRSIRRRRSWRRFHCA